MSYGNQSYLRFSIEESVWFQKGQEVDDLLSISLDPNITIVESDQYITIKGALDLTGEYTREVIDMPEEEDYFDNPKSVQIIEVRENGLHLFSHEFPVEVTIPKNRIEDMNELDVFVETFDYDFPEKSCLRLSADLTIAGLYGEVQYDFYNGEETEVEEEVELHPLSRDNQAFNEEIDYQDHSFSPPIAETKNENDQTAVFSQEPQSEVFQPFEAEARKSPQNEEKIPIMVEKEKPEMEKEEVEKEIEEPIQTIPEINFSAKRKEENQVPSPVNKVIKKEVEIVKEIAEQEEVPPQEEVIQEEVEEEVPPQEEVIQEEVEEEANLQEEVQEEEVEQPKGKKKKKKLKKNETLTLSEFFARKEEEEHTRLTMCIVQNGETVELLAERYEVPASQIQRVNGMELNQDVYEGQVLYIPVPETQR